LGKGLHSSSLSASENDWNNGSCRYYEATKNTSWNVCSNGVVFLSYADAENEKYLKKIYPANIDRDYFYLYLFGLHERETLLYYNFQIVKEWKNPKRLIQIKDELMQFTVWSGYSAVSTETAYQMFYNKLCEVLCIKELEADIDEIVEKLNDSFTSKREAKINWLLTAITILTVVSVFADSISLLDRILYSKNVFVFPHFIVLSVIVVVIAIGIIGFIRKR